MRIVHRHRRQSYVESGRARSPLRGIARFQKRPARVNAADRVTKPAGRRKRERDILYVREIRYLMQQRCSSGSPRRRFLARPVRDDSTTTRRVPLPDGPMRLFFPCICRLPPRARARASIVINEKNIKEKTRFTCETRRGSNERAEGESVSPVIGSKKIQRARAREVFFALAV